MNNKIDLSEYGKIAKDFWEQIPNHYENVNIDDYVIMPDHIDGIVIIDHCIGNIKNKFVRFGVSQVGAEHCSAPTIPYKYRNFITNLTNFSHQKNYGQLSKVIKSYKEACVKNIRKLYGDFNFSWQVSFYDEIIRNDQHLYNIQRYIRNNIKMMLDKS